MTGSDESAGRPPRSRRAAKKQPADPAEARSTADAQSAGGRTSDVASPAGAGSAPSTPLSITSHRDLIGKRTAMVAALTSDPDRARLLFANPALAFREAGVTLSPAIANHITHAIQQPPRVRTRREELTAMLTKALGEAPRPSDPEWTATTLFDSLKVAPLQVAGHEPAYIPAVPADSLDRLRGLLPQGDRVAARPVPASTAPVPVWRLDLEAAVPQLPRARRRPRKVSLPELWFYLGKHELVHPLLELGILQVSVMRVLTREEYAKVRDREIAPGFIGWIDTVEFPRQRKAPP